MKTQNTYELIYHFNPHSCKWYCFMREDYSNYWNNKNSMKHGLGIGDSAGDAAKNLLENSKNQ